MRVTGSLVAVGSAIPILMHTWWMPENISSHGYMIDKQMSETMAESGIAFVAAQLVLAGFVAMFSPDWLARAMKAIEPMIESLPLVNVIGCAVVVLVAYWTIG